MSYEIIKSISFKDKVLITSTSNNIVPSEYKKWEATRLTEILKKQGKNEAIKEILLQFWNGNFQGKSTIYGKFIENYVSKFSWENTGKREELEFSFGEIKGDVYSYEELKEDLFNKFEKFKEKTSKKNLFFVKLAGDYIKRVTTRRAFHAFDINEAKKFTLAQAEDIKKRFTNYNIEIIEV